MRVARLYLDYIDPGSYLVERRLAALEGDASWRLERRPWEVRRPPEPLIDPRDPAWTGYWDEMVARLGNGADGWPRPSLVPWTGKAHELGLFAREKGCFDRVHPALYRAFLRDGRDIGRVDVLVELGQEAGLDLTELKAVLDVDRYSDDLAEVRARAEELGVRGVPTLVLGDRVLEGVHDREALERFLADDDDVVNQDKDE